MIQINAHDARTLYSAKFKNYKFAYQNVLSLTLKLIHHFIKGFTSKYKWVSQMFFLISFSILLKVLSEPLEKCKIIHFVFFFLHGKIIKIQFWKGKSLNILSDYKFKFYQISFKSAHSTRL